MHTLAEIKAHFAAGAESVTLTRAEWESICEVMRSYCATGSERRKAEQEAERVKRIAQPVWRASKTVITQMQRAIAHGSLAIRTDRVADWEMRLRHAMTVDWHDLPAGHPRRADYRR
jgi:hypothetical protein